MFKIIKKFNLIFSRFFIIKKLLAFNKSLIVSGTPYYNLSSIAVHPINIRSYSISSANSTILVN